MNNTEIVAPHLPAASDITAFHDRSIASLEWPVAAADDLWRTVVENHRRNCAIWSEEDLARRTDAPDSEIVKNKRAIDLHNQKRNDAIEHIDEQILEKLEPVRPKPDARMNSETPGSIIDRLSILALKIYHMRIQTQRTDVDRLHVDDCAAKLSRLVEQRLDLAECLDHLLREVQSGDAYFKAYRQYKMYNDPALNPAIYNATRS
jgi:Protein of unknown function (DUF4254)